MEQGKIIKLTGGLYTVIGMDQKRHELKPVGIFRYEHIKPKVGDDVLFNEESIQKVLPRRNEMIRPAIANVDDILIVCSCKEPDFSFLLLDRFLALSLQAGIPPVIVVTKTDLLSADELTKLKAKLEYYSAYFPMFYLSTKDPEGVDAVKRFLSGKIVVVSGQTGAGKSSLINLIDPELKLETDTISKALGRGKHTTRHVELISLCGGWIADTPGFSKLEFIGFEAKTLNTLYPDFVLYRNDCRFNGCTHINEPGCKIKELLKEGKILPERYENYRRLYEEIKNQKMIY